MSHLVEFAATVLTGALFLATPAAPRRAPFELRDRDVKPVKAEEPPFQLPENVDVRKDLVYSKTGNREVVADLYFPKSGSGPFPAVIYVHGSGMPNKGTEGSKLAFRRQAALLGAKGFVGLTISYRFRTEARFPGCIYDAKAAVRWLRANAKQYRIDPERIGAVGASFGGYIVSMLATTEDLPEFEGDGSNLGVSSRVKAVVAFNALVDPIDHHRGDGGPGKFPDFVGARYEDNPELWAKASPLAHVSKRCPPFLFLSGTNDPTPSFVEDQAMMKKLLAAGVHAEFFTAEGGRHGFFHEPPWFEPTLKRMEDFLTKHLK